MMFTCVAFCGAACPPCCAAGAGASGATGVIRPCAMSPVPDSLSTVAVSCVTRVAELGEPVTMALRMLATPGMVTVLSMLLTDMSSAHAYLSGKTFITKLVICASSKAVTAAEIWAR